MPPKTIETIERPGWISRAGLTTAIVLTMAVVCMSIRGQEPRIARSSSGRVRGSYNRSTQTISYRGIPYARAPVGNRRWKAPEPLEPWKDVRNALTFGPSCPQEIVHERLPFTAEYMASGPLNEDCLYLNIWTPVVTHVRLPVLVFFHGGGFVEGSGSVPAYDGTNLARQGIVVVTVNYRLGALGYLASPLLSQESGTHATGNYGLQDQIAALRWMRANIPSFGGDASAVTVMGQSAGAMSIEALMNAPEAKGLFRRAILESGIASEQDHPFLSLQEAESRGRRLEEIAGATSVDSLRALPESRIAQIQEMLPPFRLIIDGVVLPSDPSSHMLWRVPALAGWNADELSYMEAYGHFRSDDLKAIINATDARVLARLKTMYPAGDEEINTSVIQANRDKSAVVLQEWRERVSQDGTPPVFTYYFSRRAKWKDHPEYGAHHSAEVPYVFGNLADSPREYASADRILSAQMVRYWSNFVKSGDPNGDGVPKWQPYAQSPANTQRLDEHVGPMMAVDAHVAAVWRQVLRPARTGQNQKAGTRR